LPEVKFFWAMLYIWRILFLCSLTAGGFVHSTLGGVQWASMIFLPRWTAAYYVCTKRGNIFTTKKCN